MGGGLMQLVAYGAQDIYLTGNPQITFFKVVYRRHTNFSMESIEQTWNGNSLCGRATATISRNGDLVHKLYLQQTAMVQTTCQALHNTLSESGNGNGNGGVVIYNPAHTGIDMIEVEIGGQSIDRQSGKWMEVWSQLTEPNDAGVLGVVGPNSGTKFQNMARGGGCVVTSLGGFVDKVGSGQAHAVTKLLDAGGDGGHTYHSTSPGGGKNADSGVIRTKFDSYVPLQFWFCRNPGLALPLIALQYHEVKIKITFDAALEGTDVKLFADYIYLDTDERRRFAQVSHEYLIEQVQHFKSSAEANVELNFNHPIKELIWTGEYTPGDQSGAGTSALLTGANTYQLKLNGHDRFSARDRNYFTRVQVWQHHTGFGGVTVKDSIAVYSFALKPEEHQPSGTCNFSRIDNAQLVQGVGSPQALEIYGVNYNVLRIMSGMGGLAYSN
jgi:hypothetical protein